MSKEQYLRDNPWELGGFLSSAPEMTLTRVALNQIVAWSKETGPISLERFVATRLPEQAAKLGIEPVREGELPVKRVDEMDADELKETICAIYEADLNNTYIRSDGVTSQQILDKIRRSTSSLFDRDVMSMRRNIGVMESLFEAGKVKEITAEDPPLGFTVTPPPF
jgi:hypothetical protein